MMKTVGNTAEKNAWGNENALLWNGEPIYTLSIDIETFCRLDLRTTGVYRYAEDDSSEILLLSYSVNNGPVKTIDVASGEELPEWLLDALLDDHVEKWAYNANFERVFLSYWLHRHYGTPLFLPPESWRCTMVWGAYLGLPMSLAEISRVLALDTQKLEDGSRLIRYFCNPVQSVCELNPSTKVLLPADDFSGEDGNATSSLHAASAIGFFRHMPWDAPLDWESFKRYNKRDVEVELALQKRLGKIPVPQRIWEEYALDQRINDTGILIDATLVEQALAIDELERGQILEQLKELTGLENPASTVQWKLWLNQHGLYPDTTDKKAMEALLSSPDTPGELLPILELRSQLTRNSLKKYETMQQVACADGRARGMYFFYGANRTGRFSGRLIQLQNLPRIYMEDLDETRTLVRNGNYTIQKPSWKAFGGTDAASTTPGADDSYSHLKALHPDIPDTLSQLIRTAFIPKPGCKFIVADFHAIEARILAVLAGERWRMESFARHEDIYSASASQMFRIPVEKNGENGEYRRYGKLAELALSYGGSRGALRAMGALQAGLKPEELQPLVDKWRAANPAIVSLWKEIDKAVKWAVRYGHDTWTHGVGIGVRYGMLVIALPSGRRLFYRNPEIVVGNYGNEVSYECLHMGKWSRQTSYGAKFVENIVQGLARDVLCHALTKIAHNRADCSIVGHVHDEIIMECPETVQLEDIISEMTVSPAWMPDLLLEAEGYESMYYRK